MFAIILLLLSIYFCCDQYVQKNWSLSKFCKSRLSGLGYWHVAGKGVLVGVLADMYLIID
jgi:hypothetical protein